MSNIRIRSVCATLSRRRRYLSSTRNKDDYNSNNVMASVVQGPSLVQTGLHRPAPSLMFLPGLRSLPFWTSLDENRTVNRVAFQDPIVSHVVNYLQDNVATFAREHEQQRGSVPSDYVASAEHADQKLHAGSWDWHSYMLQGAIQESFVQHFPETADILDVLRQDQLLFEGIPFGFCFVSSLHGHSNIQAHAAPMNFRLRIHLPLVVPKVSESSDEDSNATRSTNKCAIRVGPLTRQWVKGKALVLDDSYQHQVWNDTDETRVLLLVDIWHPDVQSQEREEIVAMFQHAQDQGWLKSPQQ